MVNIEKLMDEVRTLSSDQLKSVREEINLILSGISSTERQSFEDLVPIDVPIESLKDSESGVLQIRFPYQIGLRRNVGWRTIQVTPAAQAVLIQIFSESLSEDSIAGRIPPKSTTIQ